MPYTIEETKEFSHPLDKVRAAALGAIAGLEGSVLKNDPESGHIDAKFPKTILNNLLGDRTQIELDFEAISADETRVAIRVFPINPVGQKMQFGARKGVSRKVITWFIAHTEHRLK